MPQLPVVSIRNKSLHMKDRLIACAESIAWSMPGGCTDSPTALVRQCMRLVDCVANNSRLSKRKKAREAQKSFCVLTPYRLCPQAR